MMLEEHGSAKGKKIFFSASKLSRLVYGICSFLFVSLMLMPWWVLWNVFELKAKYSSESWILIAILFIPFGFLSFRFISDLYYSFNQLTLETSQQKLIWQRFKSIKTLDVLEIKDITSHEMRNLLVLHTVDGKYAISKDVKNYQSLFSHLLEMGLLKRRSVKGLQTKIGIWQIPMVIFLSTALLSICFVLIQWDNYSVKSTFLISLMMIFLLFTLGITAQRFEFLVDGIVQKFPFYQKQILYRDIGNVHLNQKSRCVELLLPTMTKYRWLRFLNGTEEKIIIGEPRNISIEEIYLAILDGKNS